MKRLILILLLYLNQTAQVYTPEMFPEILENMTKVAEKEGLEAELVVAQ
jgi:hypothetical protein